MDIKELFESLPCEVCIVNEWGTKNYGDLTIVVNCNGCEVSYQDHGCYDGSEYISRSFLCETLTEALQQMKDYLADLKKEGKLIIPKR